MEREITIDRSGRLVIPKDLRDQHHLRAGTKLRVIDDEDCIVLVPSRSEPHLVEKDGLLVVKSSRKVEVPDHRDLRDERATKLGGIE